MTEQEQQRDSQRDFHAEVEEGIADMWQAQRIAREEGITEMEALQRIWKCKELYNGS